MNLAKNMEFVFVAAFVLAVSVSNAIAAPAAPAPVAKAAAKAAPVNPVSKVVVVGKRLTAEQKAKRA